MRAKRNYVLVEADMEQKENLEITGANGEKIKLYIGREYDPNNRNRNPCVGKVIHNGCPEYPYIHEGDLLVMHYNTLIASSGFLVEMNGTIGTFSVPVRTKDFNNKTQEHEWNLNPYVFGKLIDGEIHPLCDNLICERIKMPQESEIIFNPVEKTYPNRLKALRVSPEIDYVKEGDTLLTHKMSDYEIVFHWAGKEKRNIRCNRIDIIGIIHE